MAFTGKTLTAARRTTTTTAAAIATTTSLSFRDMFKTAFDLGESALMSVVDRT